MFQSYKFHKHPPCPINALVAVKHRYFYFNIVIFYLFFKEKINILQKILGRVAIDYFHLFWIVHSWMSRSCFINRTLQKIQLICLHNYVEQHMTLAWTASGHLGEYKTTSWPYCLSLWKQFVQSKPCCIALKMNPVLSNSDATFLFQPNK